jgi:energy-coupling factor transporter ATP-binding protein EcfA2
MKILKLNAENVKRLQVVEITPTGEIVTITGRNGQGKTSVLDSIWWALAGTSHIQAAPIRRGQNKARIRLDLGELVVERRFTEGASTLSVENAEGARFPSPQKMLDALLGELSFDPLAFSRMDARRQFDELRHVARLEVDIDQLDGLNRSDYAKRTDVNRDAKALRAQADAVTFPADTPEQVANDESALVDELEDAGRHNTDLEQRRARREAAQQEIAAKRQVVAELGERAQELRRQAEALDAQAADIVVQANGLQARLDTAPTLPPPIDTAELRRRIDHARVVAGNVAKRALKAKLIGEAAAKEAGARAFTEQMEAREQAKADAIRAAQMPVEGLGFGDGLVTYNGVPLVQCSSAEQLRVSVALAMAANPKIRVIRIQDGSLLDDESLAAIAAMAKEQDYQIWIERVATDGKVGVLIEDGMVKQSVAHAPEAAA